MKTEENNIEFIPEKKEPKDKKKGLLKDLIGGGILTRESVIKQLPFIIYLSILAIFYIGNRYRAEKIVRHMMEMQEEIKELRAESISTAAQLMFASRQSEVVKMLKEKQLDIHESLEPPKKIEVR
jgi:hypothetical protein